MPCHFPSAFAVIDPMPSPDFAYTIASNDLQQVHVMSRACGLAATDCSRTDSLSRHVLIARSDIRLNEHAVQLMSIHRTLEI
jgi:hypothetical protein